MSRFLMRSIVWFWVVALFFPGASVFAASADSIVGTWVTQEGKSHVTISKQGNSYSGKIIWLKEPMRDGKPKVDRFNAKAALRSRPIIGLSILSGFVFKGDHWENGKIYNPEDGKEYSCVIKLKNATTLEVRGYFLNPALGKTQIWTKK